MVAVSIPVQILPHLSRVIATVDTASTVMATVVMVCLSKHIFS